MDFNSYLNTALQRNNPHELRDLIKIYGRKKMQDLLLKEAMQRICRIYPPDKIPSMTIEQEKQWVAFNHELELSFLDESSDLIAILAKWELSWKNLLKEPVIDDFSTSQSP